HPHRAHLHQDRRLEPLGGHAVRDAARPSLTRAGVRNDPLRTAPSYKPSSARSRSASGAIRRRRSSRCARRASSTIRRSRARSRPAAPSWRPACTQRAAGRARQRPSGIGGPIGFGGSPEHFGGRGGAGGPGGDGGHGADGGGGAGGPSVAIYGLTPADTPGTTVSHGNGGAGGPGLPPR